MFSQDYTCPDLLVVTKLLRHFKYGAITLYGQLSQAVLL